MPQASSAHDNFWDFISNTPESLNMAMWILSDRTIPRNFRAMQGFGVHTFILQNAEGKETFVKFHWTPLGGAYSNNFDEAQKLAGKDPDYFRRDLYESIARGDFPEWELGIQTVPIEDEHKFDFDLLDSTKIIPESLVPIQKIGRMILSKVPDEFFTQVEQSAFAVSRVIPGITFSNDPLLQSRIFSYHDTQLHRLGPNFHLLPTNCPALAAVANNQRDGPMQTVIHPSNVNYAPNSLAGNNPKPLSVAKGAYAHSVATPATGGKASGRKIQDRPSEKFGEHVLQAQLFYNSQSPAERQHMISAAWFELGKCTDTEVRKRMVQRFNMVDNGFAREVARGIGVSPPQPANTNDGRSTSGISLDEYLPSSASGRKVAILAMDGVDVESVSAIKATLAGKGVTFDVVSSSLTALSGSDAATKLPVDKTFLTAHSTIYDGLLIPGGAQSATLLQKEGLAIHFVNEAFKHCKPIAAVGSGVDVISATNLPVVGMKNTGSTLSKEAANDNGETITEKAAHFAKDKMTTVLASITPSAVTDSMGLSVNAKDGKEAATDVAERLAEMLKKHRFWARELDPRVPA
ncbi:heme-dependent catalase [Gonapodya prolifera JEL478]|uniref:catalase n=1 Tax=Gonapodya prolifera (strain JEL478) TaxID=1344416 RepID=A0A139A779_GONPJ|nr:heme-dependent catalase [Gonapodya prolifera JEL478]|eukprot:KXS12315.1 heme-dependent catalase [Gonapodya prolifera JEL478]